MSYHPTKRHWLEPLKLLLVLMAFCGCGPDADLAVDEQKDGSTDDSGLSTFRIMILGDSLTEGYGVPEEEAYPALLEKKLNSLLSPKTQLDYEVINGGISGATTSGGVSRIEWFLSAKPDYLLVALGGNDGLRGIPVSEIAKNIDSILSAAKKNKIPVMLAAMKIPPNYGESYTSAFTGAFDQLAKEHAVPYIPFLLEGVGGNPEMNLPDRIHPNPSGHRVMCETVYQNLASNLH
jgi:acyl-CoA thioesterase-1